MDTKMEHVRRAAARLAAIPLLMAIGCSDGEPVPASSGTGPIDHALAVALEGDSATATFQDTALILPVPPEPERRTPSPAATRPAASSPSTPPQAPVQQAETRSEPEEVSREPNVREAVVRVGTLIRLTLNDELSTETNQPGDAFRATLVDAVVDEDGSVLLPAGASVRGRVVHVKKSGRAGETAVLNVAFEAISFGGVSHPLDASVVQANPERVTRQSTGEQVGKVAVGAAAGAILGRVIGGKNRDAVKGAVVGAAAGTAIALGTADVDAVLKAGSLMVIRTESPIRVVVGGYSPAS